MKIKKNLFDIYFVVKCTLHLCTGVNMIMFVLSRTACPIQITIAKHLKVQLLDTDISHIFLVECPSTVPLGSPLIRAQEEGLTEPALLSQPLLKPL